jgi:hypothetical protein
VVELVDLELQQDLLLQVALLLQSQLALVALVAHQEHLMMEQLEATQFSVQSLPQVVALEHVEIYL